MVRKLIPVRRLKVHGPRKHCLTMHIEGGRVVPKKMVHRHRERLRDRKAG